MYRFAGAVGFCLLASVVFGEDDSGYHGPGTVIELHGSGTTNPSKLLWKTMDKFEGEAKSNLHMTYRAVGSSTGQAEFIGADNTPAYTPYADFGSGDMPITADDYNTLTGEGIEIMHYPFVLGAMSFFHNIPGLPISGEGGLVVTGCLLAKIFSRAITTWDDAEIIALNADLDVPEGEPIIVYHRTHGSSTTKGITSYLHASCPSIWTSEMVGSEITWDTDTVAVEGSGEMSSNIEATPFSIGYIDSGHGHDDGLKEIELTNDFGTVQSSLEAGAAGVAAAAAAALADGVMPADPKADFSVVSLMNMEGETTWPIVAISYMYVRVDQSTTEPEKAELLVALMKYLVSDEVVSDIGEFGFYALPGALIDANLAAIDLITMPTDSTPFTFELSTDAGDGQGDFVISAKRRSYVDYKFDKIDDTLDTLTNAVGAADHSQNIHNIHETLVSMEEQILTLSAQVANLVAAQAHFDEYMHEHGDAHDEVKDDTDKNTTGASMGLILAILALVVAVMSLVCLFMSGAMPFVRKGGPLLNSAGSAEMVSQQANGNRV